MRPALRQAAATLTRYIVTPEVAKHRIFAWVDKDIIPDHKLHVFTRDDDYFFGVLQSFVHESWTLATCSWIGKGNDPSYNSDTVFLTFPFPGRPEPNPPKTKTLASKPSPTPHASLYICAMHGSIRPARPKPT